MTVYFIGAGPGAPDLITVRGHRLIERCPVCLYAGSLVPSAIVATAPPGATVLDTASMTLDEIIAHMVAADDKGADVARVHSGDPSIYGAIGEQLATLAQSRATLAIHLSINNLVPVVRELTPHYGPDCPAIVAYRVSWPDQQIIQGTLADIRDKVKPLGITRTALILVGHALAADLDAADAFANSQLYDPGHHHVLRPQRTE